MAYGNFQNFDKRKEEGRPMDNLWNIALRATNPEQGIDREYVICLGKDLLGYWSVMTHYGRYGRRGAARTTSFATKQEACQYINLKLKRRLSAAKRIGCNYEPTRLEGAQDILQSMSQEVTDKFLGI